MSRNAENERKIPCPIESGLILGGLSREVYFLLERSVAEVYSYI